jgi:hypothetical protein
MGTERFAGHGRRWRRRRLARLGWPLTLALAVPAAQAAAYLPAAEADPPTGDAAAAEASAAEPLRGNGIDWRFAPWRVSGTLLLDARWLKFDSTGTSRFGAISGDVEGASYLWQPWFAQVRLGMGWLATRDSRDAPGSAESDTSTGTTLTGRATIAVFPSSRFPFELRAESSDSRVSGDTLGTDLRTQRLSLSQQYRPTSGNDNYQLHLDWSRLNADGLRDTLITADGTAEWIRGSHRFEFSGNASDNRSDGGFAVHTRLAALNARHAYHPETGLDVESLAGWNHARVGTSVDELSDSGDFGSEVRQVSSIATWRPRSGELLYVDGGSTLITGSARWVEVRDTVTGGSQAASANLTLGASSDITPVFRLSGSAVANHFESSLGNTADALGVAAAIAWVPEMQTWRSWRYAPGSSVNVGITRGDGQSRDVAAAQFTHSVSRDFEPADGHRLSLSLAQGTSLQNESGDSGGLSRGLSHSAGLFWQGAGDGADQRYASLSFSDSRNWSDSGDASYQLVNLQVTQRSQISRFASWSANLTAQASRSRGVLPLAELPDGTLGGFETIDTGWQRFASGSASVEQLRLFGIPRLRLTLVGSVNSQEILRRSAGDADAPVERISHSLEARLDYSIGRVEARLSARAARVDGSDVAAVVARVQRRF